MEQFSLPPKPPRKSIVSNLIQISETTKETQQLCLEDKQSTEDVEVELPKWNDYYDGVQQLEIEGRGKFQIYLAGSVGPIVMCIHGGGYTGLTWALLAQKIKFKCQVVAPDLRGHGCSQTVNDADLSRQTISKDIIAIYNRLFPVDPPPTILVGHSMGGAMAVWTAQCTQTIPSLQGVVVLDVVEGTAMASLSHMVAVLDKRPKQFPSVSSAIKWSVQSGQSKNKLAAALSIPSQLCQQQNDNQLFTWRTDLYASQQYWKGWYQGLSNAFLSLRVSKVLILVGTDRLDKTLIIGQMQGKFQQVLLPEAGHAIHEDEVDKVADVLINFLSRYKLICNED